MSFNIMDMVKGQVSDQLVGQIGGLLGESPDKARNAVDSALPTLLAGIGESAQDANGADALFNLVNRQDDSVVDNIGSMIGSNQSSELIESGTRGLGSLLGSNGVTTMITGLAGQTGLGKGSAGSLLGLMTPMVVGQLKRKAGADGLNASGLASMLKGQGTNISAAMPSGMIGQLEAAGFGEARSSGGGFSGGKVAAGAAAATAGVAAAAGTVGRGAGNAASGAAGAVRGAAGSAGNAAHSAASSAGNAARDAASSAGNVARGAAGSAGDAARGAASSAGNAARGAASSAKGAVSGAADATRGAAGAAGRGVSNAAGAATGAVAGAGKAVSGAAGNAADATRNAAGSVGGSVGGSVSRTAGNVADSARGAASSAGRAVDRGVDAAGNKVGGAVDSTRSAAGNATRSASNTASSATDSRPTGSAASRSTTTGTTDHVAPRKSGGFWKWLIPLLLAVLAWFGFKSLGTKDVDVSGAATEATDAASSAAGDAAGDAADAATDAAGDAADAASGAVGELSGKFGDFFGSATESLEGITDADSATAALPDLEKAGESLGGLASMVSDGGDEAKSAVSGALTEGMGKLGPVVEKLQGDSGIWGVLEPVVGPMMETLKGMM